jgi:hypothetical protein
LGVMVLAPFITVSVALELPPPLARDNIMVMTKLSHECCYHSVCFRSDQK